MKLNLGCRGHLLPGYTNIDKKNIPIVNRPPDAAFMRMDVLDLDITYAPGSIDQVYSNHLFEHLTHDEITRLLYQIWVVLKPGGEIVIIVPDYWKIMCHYKEKHMRKEFEDVDLLHMQVFDVEEDTFHKSVWYSEIGYYYLTREHLYENIAIKEDGFDVIFSATTVLKRYGTMGEEKC